MNGTYSTMISAAMGGTVTTPGSSLVIPGGALSADTNIVVTVGDKTGQPNEADIATKIFTFGPDGTKFNAPVTMTLEFDGIVPMGKTAQLVFLQDGKWVPLADSAVSGTKVVATTTHFTPFTILFVSGQGQTGGQCMPGYTPCGGDLNGTWNFTAACATFPAGADPFKGQCPGAALGITVDLTGTFMASGGMYTVNQNLTFTETLDAPKSCLGGMCAGLAKDFPDIMDTGTNCKGSTAPMASNKMDSGTVSTSGTTVTFTGTSSGSSPTTGDYCVAGNTLTVRTNPSKSGDPVVIYTATK